MIYRVHDRYWQLTRLIFLRLLIITGLLILIHRLQVPPVVHGERAELMINVLYLFIILLFIFSLIYLFWLRSRWQLELLTRVQCAVDPVLITALVVLTGGFESPLHFLYGLAVLNTALLLGRGDALVVAGMVLLLFLVAITITDLFFNTSLKSGSVLFGRMIFHGVAYLVTALLGGALAEKAMGLQRAVERQKDSLANMASLNQQIIEAMPYGLISVNTQGIIRSINGEVERILGLNLPLLLNHPLKTILPAFNWMVQKANRQPVYLEIVHQDKILGVNLSLLTDHQQEMIGSLIVIRDLSQQKELERELAKREKLALTGRMAAYVAHEIRNPLASILSAAQMLPLREEPEFRRRLRDIILEEIGRLNQLISDFLFFSRTPDPEIKKVVLLDFFNEMKSVLQGDPRWSGDRLLQLEVDATHEVFFDPAQLRQVFWNVLINAIQATEPPLRVRVASQQQNDKIYVFVEDNGPGILPELLESVFEPFFTTRSTGTGLGLAVVAHCMRLNRGSIELRNLPDGGLQVGLIMEKVWDRSV
ncbi:MAG: ATP-binding protein [Magnetococcus sp. DMHC-6]